jgi:hypothetical protein
MSEPSFDEVCDRLEIPPAFRKHIAPSAAPRGRMAAARGILPAPPKVLLAMQYVLVGDGDPNVAAAAEKSLVSMPANIVEGLLNLKTHAKLLEFFAYKRTDDEALMERIVLLRQVNDKTVFYLAENGSERIAEMISQNQERLIITPQILRFLRRNPRSLASTLERVVSFLRLHGIDVDTPTPEELAESEAARKALRAAELAETAPVSEAPPVSESPAPPPSTPPAARGGPSALPADHVPGELYTPPVPDTYEVPPGLENPLAALLRDWGIALEPSFVAPPDQSDTAGPPILTAVAAGAVAPAVSAPPAAAPGRRLTTLTADLTGLTSIADSEFAFGFEEDDDEFDPYLTRDDESAHTSDEMRGDIAKIISAMKMGEKIKLAYKGNKAVREILIRDTNKVVACAVVKSGRLTDNEVVSIAGNRAVAEDVIRELARVKENLRMYPVKVALCTNPKTPVPVAMKLISSLHVADLKKLARNRNVSSAVFTAATKLSRQRDTTR